jgi:hypothetical protein
MKPNWHRGRRLLAAILIVLGVACAALYGCGSGSSGTQPAPPQPTTTRAVLRGSQQNPAVATNASGFAVLTTNAEGTEISVRLETTGLTNVTRVHIHVGRVGVNGPVLFTLVNQAAGALTTPLNRTLRAANLQTQPAFGINTFADAINAINSGNAYVNIHTTGNPDGVIRGQIGPVNAFVVLNGASQVPPVNPAVGAIPPFGTAFLSFDPAQSTISVSLETTNLNNVTGATINAGAPGANGPVMFTLASAAFTSPLAVGLQPGNVQTNAGAGINNFDDALNAMLSGNAYINITTQSNTTGHIRGQIGWAGSTSLLRGANQVPPVTTTATGTVRAALDAKRSALTFVLSTLNAQGNSTLPVANVRAIHIHAGGSGVNGPVLFTLYTQGDPAFTGVLTRTIRAADLTPGGGINSFADFVNALTVGAVYVNVHTNAFPDGEIRGQLLLQQ